MAQRITVRAFAKVNLALAVGPALPPGHAKAGYHPIASWMTCIDLADEVTVTRRDEGLESRYRIRWGAEAPRQSPIDWPIEKDLAVRAHRLLEREAGRSLPVELDLLKRIPVGGGLGGGSSDAASVLRAVDGLFGLGFGAARLAELGSALGSDVGFFVDDQEPSRPALVTGLGESVVRLGPLNLSLVLVVPPFGCETRAVYRAFDTLPGHGPDRARVESCIRASAPGAGLFNDLAAAAARVDPRVDRLLELARDLAGLPANLSGSGSGIFLLCPPGEEEHRAAELRSALKNPALAVSEGWVEQVRVVGTRLV